MIPYYFSVQTLKTNWNESADGFGDDDHHRDPVWGDVDHDTDGIDIDGDMKNVYELMMITMKILMLKILMKITFHCNTNNNGNGNTNDSLDNMSG